MDATRISERTRLAIQVAMCDKRVRRLESDTKIDLPEGRTREHLIEQARQSLDAARAAYDAGPQEVDPIEAKATQMLEAEVERNAVKDRFEELRIKDPRIDTSKLEAGIAAKKEDGGFDT